MIICVCVCVHARMHVRMHVHKSMCSLAGIHWEVIHKLSGQADSHGPSSCHHDLPPRLLYLHIT